jgi:hypothetical protein
VTHVGFLLNLQGEGLDVAAPNEDDPAAKDTSTFSFFFCAPGSTYSVWVGCQTTEYH